MLKILLNKLSNQPKKQRIATDLPGFTIIEVALVLAIAGLIFLVVFIAWPALQNAQKDAARRQDVGRVVSALEAYKVDNQGDLSSLVGMGPGGGLAYLLAPYVGNLSGAAGVWISPTVLNVSTETPTSDWIDVHIQPQNFCDGETGTPTLADANVVVKLSSGQRYCASM